jgi:hypothetical protein
VGDDRQPEGGPPQADSQQSPAGSDSGSNGKSENKEPSQTEKTPLSEKDQFGMMAELGKAGKGRLQLKATGLWGGIAAIGVLFFICCLVLSPMSNPTHLVFFLILAGGIGWTINELANRKVVRLLEEEKENYRLEAGRVSDDKRKFEEILLKQRRSSIPPPKPVKRSTEKPSSSKKR